jgi:RNA polymerase-binding transcription factor DksA
MALSPEQRQELGSAIDARRRQLLAELRDDAARARREQYGDLAGPSPDPGDESVADLISDLDQADMTRDLDELRAVDAARDRIAEGRYGICVDCGGEIEYERLRASPAALRCIHCQRLYEKTHSGNTPPPTL